MNHNPNLDIAHHILRRKALLLSYYGIKDWKVPENYLCPPIPSRADYVHHVSDLISSSSQGKYDATLPLEGNRAAFVLVNKAVK
jgi:23S rRNA A1618 N6-methylase RlmF